MEKGDALLQAYAGPYVVESFHPMAMRWYKEHRPETCRGQLIEPLPFGQTDMTYWAAGRLLFNWLSRPDFVACDWRSGGSPQVRLARAMGAVPVSWTVRNRDEVAECAFRDWRYFAVSWNVSQSRCVRVRTSRACWVGNRVPAASLAVAFVGFLVTYVAIL